MRKAQEAQWKLDDCACLVTTTKYIKMCAEHEREWQKIHEKWSAEKKATEKERDTLLVLKEDSIS